eukprot:TRINITY_DN6414_c0_g1_i3.p1 TRINITY_DN6414_c0_g1~~TRINITY_DN6414_c0_g1_i3.p1  ORF type:complete len:1038 (+),score=141.90 TRINITY_DN6414_c0_g1_i3:235-3348(+)
MVRVVGGGYSVPRAPAAQHPKRGRAVQNKDCPVLRAAIASEWGASLAQDGVIGQPPIDWERIALLRSEGQQRHCVEQSERIARGFHRDDLNAALVRAELLQLPAREIRHWETRMRILCAEEETERDYHVRTEGIRRKYKKIFVVNEAVDRDAVAVAEDRERDAHNWAQCLAALTDAVTAYEVRVQSIVVSESQLRSVLCESEDAERLQFEPLWASSRQSALSAAAAATYSPPRQVARASSVTASGLSPAPPRMPFLSTPEADAMIERRSERVRLRLRAIRAGEERLLRAHGRSHMRSGQMFSMLHAGGPCPPSPLTRSHSPFTRPHSALTHRSAATAPPAGMMSTSTPRCYSPVWGVSTPVARQPSPPPPRQSRSDGTGGLFGACEADRRAEVNTDESARRRELCHCIRRDELQATSSTPVPRPVWRTPEEHDSDPLSPTKRVGPAEYLRALRAELRELGEGGDCAVGSRQQSEGAGAGTLLGRSQPVGSGASVPLRQGSVRASHAQQQHHQHPPPRAHSPLPPPSPSTPGSAVRHRPQDGPVQARQVQEPPRAASPTPPRVPGSGPVADEAEQVQPLPRRLSSSSKRPAPPPTVPPDPEEEAAAKIQSAQRAKLAREESQRRRLSRGGSARRQPHAPPTVPAASALPDDCRRMSVGAARRAAAGAIQRAARCMLSRRRRQRRQAAVADSLARSVRADAACAIQRMLRGAAARVLRKRRAAAVEAALDPAPAAAAAIQRMSRGRFARDERRRRAAAVRRLLISGGCSEAQQAAACVVQRCAKCYLSRVEVKKRQEAVRRSLCAAGDSQADRDAAAAKIQKAQRKKKKKHQSVRFGEPEKPKAPSRADAACRIQRAQRCRSARAQRRRRQRAVARSLAAQPVDGRDCAAMCIQRCVRSALARVRRARRMAGVQEYRCLQVRVEAALCIQRAMRCALALMRRARRAAAVLTCLRLENERGEAATKIQNVERKRVKKQGDKGFVKDRVQQIDGLSLGSGNLNVSSEGQLTTPQPSPRRAPLSEVPSAMADIGSDVRSDFA